MERFFDALRPLLRTIVRHPLAVVALALALSALGLLSAAGLRIDTDLANLLPDDYPSVQALETLRETVGSETPVDVGVESPAFGANLAFAEALIPEALALRRGGEPLFTRAEFRKDTTFLSQNALYFASDQELDQLEAFLETAAEDARLEANPFFVDLDDDLGLDDDEDSADLEASLSNLQVREYPVSPDSTVLAVRLFPSGAQTNIGGIRETYRRLDSLVAAMAPSGFHPAMEVTTAGRLLRQQVEIDAITDDVRGSFGLGAAAVLLFVVLYFFYKAVQVRGLRRDVVLSELARLPVTAVLIGLPLLMSLAWTFGVAGLTLGSLNLMTSTLALVLFGLGIDYGIHFYARYTEERGRGRGVEDAAETTFVSTGLAVAVSAATTAVALFALTVADFRGFSEFGWIGGLGIVFALVAMLLVLPALLALAERWGLLRLEAGGAPAGAASRRPFPAVRLILALSLVATLASLVALPNERFEYDFSSLEPEYRAYYDRADRIAPALGGSGRRNPAYLVLEDTADVRPVVDELRRRAEEDTLILAVESLQERFPTTPAAARQKLDRLEAIRALADDPFLRRDSTGEIARVRRAASTTAPIPLGRVPDDLKRTFTSKSGEVGTFVIVYPAVNLSEDARLSMAFSDAVGTVEANGTTYHAGSTSIVAAEMLRLMLAESPLMLGITFALIAGLMLLVFRSVRWTLLALLPLVVGVLWMLGAMVLTGVSLTFYNLVVLPAVLGIGNDCGVHLVHRYREEGAGSLRTVLRSTGEHVAMGALTTMIGFSGLLLSFHPGLRSIGLLAVIGIGTTLLAALLFLPAVLQWLEDRRPTDPLAR